MVQAAYRVRNKIKTITGDQRERPGEARTREGRGKALMPGKMASCRVS